MENIPQFVDADKIVFGDVTIYLCVPYIFNIITYLGSTRIPDLFQREKMHYNVIQLYFQR